MGVMGVDRARPPLFVKYASWGREMCGIENGEEMDDDGWTMNVGLWDFVMLKRERAAK